MSAILNSLAYVMTLKIHMGVLWKALHAFLGVHCKGLNLKTICVTCAFHCHFAAQLQFFAIVVGCE